MLSAYGSHIVLASISLNSKAMKKLIPLIEPLIINMDWL